MKETIYKIISGLYIMLGVTGILFSFTHAFEIHYMEKTVYGALVIVCVLAVGVFGRKKRTDKWIVWGSLFVGAAAMWMIDKESFISSCDYVGNRILSELSQQLGDGHSIKFHIEARNGEDALIWIFAVLTAVIAWEVMREKHLWLAGALLGIGFLIPFIIRKEPKNSEVFLILIAIVGLVSMKAAGKRSFGIPGVLAAMTAFCIGTVFLTPTLQTVFQETKQSEKNPLSIWSEQMDDWFQEKSASGGIDNGKIGDYDQLILGDEEQLIVSTDEKPSEILYLQGFIGTSYANNEWKAIRTDAFKKWSRQNHTDAIEIRNLPFQEFRKRGELLKIENTGANKKYRYMPYLAYYDETISLEADTYAKGGREKEYKVSYGIMGTFSGEIEIQNELEKAYYEFVQKEYLDVPQNIEDAFEEIVEGMIGWNFDTIVDNIIELLAENATYSLKPGATPLGKDAVEYFYFENKKGYCEHFASAATLLLRMKGIPARFVAGYKVGPAQFKNSTANGYEAVVTGKDAHAWAEAYVEGIGWLPVETTPGYGDVSRWDSQQMFEDSQTEIEEQKEAKEDQKEEIKKEEKESEKEPVKEAEDEPARTEGATNLSRKEKMKVSYAVVGILAVFAVSGTGIVCAKRYRLAQKRKKEEKENNTIRTRRLFYRIFEMLTAMKLVKKETELDDAFVKQVCDGCAAKHTAKTSNGGFLAGIEEADMEKLLEIVYKANFGNEMVTDKEYYLCRKIEETIKKAFIAKISFWKKIWWKYWKGIL